MTNTTFAQLKKNRKSNFEKLNEELKKAAGGKVEFKKDDDRIWYPDVDKVGNGYAVIRFLPAPEGEDVPFVRKFRHAFQGPTGSWYIENSLTTLGLPDPAGEYNTKLWNTGREADKDIARKQKRKLEYFSNIYVIKDGANPENEGKVFIFRYGKKIFDKLFEANNPKFEDEKALDPFDLWEGANFKLKIRNVEGYRNYDSSSFDAPSKLFADDGKLEKIWKQAHALKPFIDPKEFKSYDELKSKLNRVIGVGIEPEHEDHPDERLEQFEKAHKPKAKAAAPKNEPELEPEVEGDDDDLNFFRNIADDTEEELLA
jgi:gp32 DNA binding protein like